MRISDWSSDVCSSDLQRAAPLVEGEKNGMLAAPCGGQRERQGQRGLSDPRSADEKRVGSPPQATAEQFVDLGIAARRKIGRASCRERVCQYVSISVVAVSLKKKNNL